LGRTQPHYLIILHGKKILQLKIRQQIGLWRSLIIYYCIPFRGRRLTHFYRPFIQPGDLCFDIGAHVGNRTRAWTKLGARVVALEPQPQLMRFLQRWYGHRTDITLLEEAAGAEAGHTTMYISRLTPTVTSLSPKWINSVREDQSFANVLWDDAVPVRVTTLDQLIERFGTPALCKIDVEGYEFEVLKGLSQPLVLVSFEYIPATIELSISCVARLSQIGQYEFNWLVGENYRFSSPIWLNEADIVDKLKSSLKTGRSGDIYARLKRN
jgi:FkbM family methyltransferase